MCMSDRAQERHLHSIHIALNFTARLESAQAVRRKKARARPNSLGSLLKGAPLLGSRTFPEANETARLTEPVQGIIELQSAVLNVS